MSAVEFYLHSPRDVYQSAVLHHVALVVRTSKPASLPTATLTTTGTRLRVVGEAALAFLLDLSVVEDEHALRPHRLAIVVNRNRSIHLSWKPCK